MGSPHSEEKRETQSGMREIMGASHNLKKECGEITDVEIGEIIIISAPHKLQCGVIKMGNSTHSGFCAALQSEKWKDNGCPAPGGKRSD